MKVVKLTKKMLKMLPEDLIVALGATSGGQGYPWLVYLSNTDYKKLKKRVHTAVSKKYAYLPPNKKETTVTIEMLNYGPNQSLGAAIKPGWALVDTRSIFRHTKNKTP